MGLVRTFIRQSVLRTGLFPALTAAVMCLFWNPSAQAQSANYSSDESRTQFVFVIDDSGSMKTNNKWTGADNDRVAIMAARALLQIIDDTDSATVVRLNRKYEADDSQSVEAPLPIARLNAPHRQAIDAQLDTVAGYDGNYTPCKSALDDARSLLNDAHQSDPDAQQVVFFLTDGKCTQAGGKPDETPDSDAFLSGVTSAESGNLQFYFLGFDVNQEQAKLNGIWQPFTAIASNTNGIASVVDPRAPKDILEAFAKAIAHAKGLASYVRDSRFTQPIPAHSGASEIRLLSLVPNGDASVQFDLKNDRGQAISQSELKRASASKHQYKDGKSYGYASVRYPPKEFPVQVGVKGNPPGWAVIAIPFYRLSVTLNAYPLDSQSCASLPFSQLNKLDPAQIVDHNTFYCMVTTILGGKDGKTNVTSDIVGGGKGVKASVVLEEREQAPGSVEAGTTTEVPLDPFDGGSVQGFTRHASTDGSVLTYQSVVTLEFDGAAKDQRPQRRSRQKRVQVMSTENEWVGGSLPKTGWTGGASTTADGASVLVPGGQLITTATLRGNLPDATVTASLKGLERFDSSYACVTVEVNGAAEGQPTTVQWAEAGKDVQLILRADRFCGATSNPVGAADVQLIFEGDGTPPPSLPLSFVFENRFSATVDAPDGRVTLEKGATVDAAFTIQSNLLAPSKLPFTLASMLDPEVSTLPEGSEFTAAETGELVGGSDALRLPFSLTVPGCCDEGSSYAAPVKLRPDVSEEIAAMTARHAKRTGLSAEAIQKDLLKGLPEAVPVSVVPDAANACLWQRIFMILKILLGLWLLWFLFNVWTRSKFLKADGVPGVQPLSWQYGAAEPVESSTPRSAGYRIKVDDQLGWTSLPARLVMWLLHAWRLGLHPLPGCRDLEYWEVLKINGLEPPARDDDSISLSREHGFKHKFDGDKSVVFIKPLGGGRADVVWQAPAPEDLMTAQLVPETIADDLNWLSDDPELDDLPKTPRISLKNKILIWNPKVNEDQETDEPAGWKFS